MQKTFVDNLNFGAKLNHGYLIMQANIRTYSEWQTRGYRIHKGQRAVGFKDGEALFEARQVYNPRANELSEACEAYCIRAMQWEEQQF